MGLFFLLGLSTLIFGSVVLYKTYELDHLDGRTVIMGNVLDKMDRPIEGVRINCSDRQVFSDENGFWELKGVPQGYITIEFYKPGYVRYSLKWLAYPQDAFEEIEKSPNNISYSFTESGADDIQLSREMEQIRHSDYKNGTLTLTISQWMIQRTNMTEIFVSNGSGPLESRTIDASPISIDVNGDGSYFVGFSEDGPRLNGFHPVGNEINISNGLFVLWNSNMSDDHQIENGTIDMVIDQNGIYDQVHLSLIDNISGEVVRSSDHFDQDEISIDVQPGIYDIEITGESIRDRVFRGVVLNSSEYKMIQTTFVEGDVIKDLELSLTGNYFIAAAYLGISLVLFYAALYMRKGGSWAVLLILAFVGFISQGFHIYIFNINSLIAVVLMVVLFSIRSEYNRKRQRMISARGARRL
jgi:hypothetical protein